MSTAHDPTLLGALETGYEQGHIDAITEVRAKLIAAGLDLDSVDLEGDYANPFTKLFDDRRAYVREQVTDTFGSITNEDGDDLFDCADAIDTILDAHADWLAGQRVPQSVPADTRELLTTAHAVSRELRGDGPPPHTDEPADVIDALAAALTAALGGEQ